MVRREVLSHLGYKRIDLAYIHHSWNNNGKAVDCLDLCFLPMNDSFSQLPTKLIVKFLKGYYSVLANKPESWHTMIEALEAKETIDIWPI